MDANDSRLQYLISRYLNDTCTVAELQEFWQHIQTLKDDAPVREQLQQLWHTNAGANKQAPPQGWEKTLQRIYSNAHEWEQEQSVIPMQPVLKRRSWRIAVAASVLLAISVASYFLFFNQKDKSGEIVNIEPPKDVEAPKATKAMLTLTDGSRVSIDSLTSVNQGEVQLVKTADGKIVYSGNTNDIAYNTLSNPRGSKVVSLRLSDGTQVWLNAESSVKYPTAFTGNERSVEITGEAYFEVAKDKRKKFFVNAKDVRTEVLGTHFNVNSFTDEGNVKITLLEGSIKVTTGVASGLLKPGQQAQVANELAISNQVDVEEVMAWKNGRFVFANASVDVVMNQVARWYDVDIAYEGAKPSVHFVGDISRLENVSELLKMLEQTKAVRFSIEGRKIIVKK